MGNARVNAAARARDDRRGGSDGGSGCPSIAAPTSTRDICARLTTDGLSRGRQSDGGSGCSIAARRTRRSPTEPLWLGRSAKNGWPIRGRDWAWLKSERYSVQLHCGAISIAMGAVNERHSPLSVWDCEPFRQRPLHALSLKRGWGPRRGRRSLTTRTSESDLTRTQKKPLDHERRLRPPPRAPPSRPTATRARPRHGPRVPARVLSAELGPTRAPQPVWRGGGKRAKPARYYEKPLGFVRRLPRT